MLSEWIIEGVAFGVKAFMAVAIFLLCGGAVAGVLALISSAFGGVE